VRVVPFFVSRDWPYTRAVVMEWIKLSLDRLFGLLAALVPGSAILLVLVLNYPEAALRAWQVDYLDYRTKVAISLFGMFLSGWTLSTAFRAVEGIIGVLVGVFLGRKTRLDSGAKPWRDPNWRALLSQYLQHAAPEDIEPVSDEVLQYELAQAEEYPDPERLRRIIAAHQKKSTADLNEFRWAGWWRELHSMLLRRLDSVELMSASLNSNFLAASITLLCGSTFTPSLRQWWLMSLCMFWVVFFFVQAAAITINYLNPFSSFGKQIAYLQARKSPTEPER
jgi:hypothetical protein